MGEVFPYNAIFFLIGSFYYIARQLNVENWIVCLAMSILCGKSYLSS